MGLGLNDPSFDWTKSLVWLSVTVSIGSLIFAPARVYSVQQLSAKSAVSSYKFDCYYQVASDYTIDKVKVARVYGSTTVD